MFSCLYSIRTVEECTLDDHVCFHRWHRNHHEIPTRTTIAPGSIVYFSCRVQMGLKIRQEKKSLMLPYEKQHGPHSSHPLVFTHPFCFHGQHNLFSFYSLIRALTTVQGNTNVFRYLHCRSFIQSR